MNWKIFNGAPTGAFTVDLAGTPRLLLAEGLAAPPSVSSGKLSFSDLPAHGFAFVSLD